MQEKMDVSVKENQTVNPMKIMQVGMGFMASKTLLSAVELDIFSLLAQSPKTAGQLRIILDLNERGLYDFLDALVSLGFLNREEVGPEALYRNTEETAVFLDRKSPGYLGGILKMANRRLYPYWGRLTEALKTGQQQNEARSWEESPFEAIYSDPDALVEFQDAMAGIQLGNFMALADKFNFSKAMTLCDAGGGNGLLCSLIAQRHDHLYTQVFDLPQVEPIVTRTAEKMGVADRVSFTAGDFFKESIPSCDIITMGNILHDWDLPRKKALIHKAYSALPPGGVFIAIENMIDSERRQNTFGLIMSLNMLIETPGGSDYTTTQFEGWCKEVGFKRVEFLPLMGPASAGIAYK
jgi:2-polyprenyl-3-methyl-5-hydroxy-6-metoxy-1,4-benzoquinol methylase